MLLIAVVMYPEHGLVFMGLKKHQGEVKAIELQASKSWDYLDVIGRIDNVTPLIENRRRLFGDYAVVTGSVIHTSNLAIPIQTVLNSYDKEMLVKVFSVPDKFDVLCIGTDERHSCHTSLQMDI